MSQNNQPNPSTEPVPDLDPTPPPAAEPMDALPDVAPSVPVPEDESTIGTGTSMALGCIAGTVVLIIFGLLFLFVSTLV